MHAVVWIGGGLALGGLGYLAWREVRSTIRPAGKPGSPDGNNPVKPDAARPPPARNGGGTGKVGELAASVDWARAAKEGGKAAGLGAGVGAAGGGLVGGVIGGIIGAGCGGVGVVVGAPVGTAVGTLGGAAAGAGVAAGVGAGLVITQGLMGGFGGRRK